MPHDIVFICDLTDDISLKTVQIVYTMADFDADDKNRYLF